MNRAKSEYLSALVGSGNFDKAMEVAKEPDEPMIICQFSCGVASAVATKLILSEYLSEQVRIINAFIQEEHADNQRFMADCERWFGCPIERLRDEKYGASTDIVWEKRRFIKGKHGATCSTALKREVLNAEIGPEDSIVLGYTIEELDRLDNYIDANNGRKVLTPLIDRRFAHDDCMNVIVRAGIDIPAMYKLGFRNNNCIGCPKGGQAYWQAIRHHFPERFEAVSAIQRSIGAGSYFLQFRSGPRKGERMPLWELPPGRGNMDSEPSFSCGVLCELVEIAGIKPCNAPKIAATG